MSKNPRGATGFGPAKKAKTQMQVDPSRSSNGHCSNGHVESVGTSTRGAATSSSSEQTARLQPHVNGINGHSPGNLVVYKVSETSPIIKRLFHRLLTDSGVEKDVIRAFEVSEHALRRHPKSQMICKATDLSVEYIQTSENTLEALIEEIGSEGYGSTQTTMYTEFRKIVGTLFDDGIHFGRVLSFLRFSAAFAVLVYRNGLKRAVPSIQAWTVEVIEEDLGQYFTENKGWEGYLDYMEVLLRSHRRGKKPPTANNPPQSVWDSMYAFGAVAIGGAALYTLKQVFS